jgi:hypothetical protein
MDFKIIIISLLECGIVLPDAVFDGTVGITVLELRELINRHSRALVDINGNCYYNYLLRLTHINYYFLL